MPVSGASGQGRGGLSARAALGDVPHHVHLAGGEADGGADARGTVARVKEAYSGGLALWSAARPDGAGRQTRTHRAAVPDRPVTWKDLFLWKGLCSYIRLHDP